MTLRQVCGFCLGLLGTFFMWQLGVALAHFLHASIDVRLPDLLMDTGVMVRVTSATAAFLAGLAALTERRGGAWLAGLSTFMFATITLGLIQGRISVTTWRDDYVYLSILTTLFLALVVLRQESDDDAFDEGNSQPH